MDLCVLCIQPGPMSQNMASCANITVPIKALLRCFSKAQCSQQGAPAQQVSSHNFDTGLSRLPSKSCLRCFRFRFILDMSLSNTSPERRADTKSSNSLRSSSAAFFALCSLSFFSCRGRQYD